jgi:HAMP domain-containing protein
MKLSEKLLLVASWLEDSENDLIVNAEVADGCLTTVAAALIKASSALKEGAEEVSKIEPSGITLESLDEIAAVAQAFDESGDELLKKQASVLDEIMLTIAAPRSAFIDFRQAQDDRIEELKKKYKDTKSHQDELNKVSDSIKAIENSAVYKTYRPLEAALSTRYCPDHPGGLVVRVGEHTWQCVMDKKVYSYESGFKTMQGNIVPGGDVAQQTPDHAEEGHAIFDTRDSRLGQDSK